jgi:hypothetical protein
VILETFLEHFAARDPAADVADHAAEPSAQEFELAARPLELVRVRVAPHHDRGVLADAPVALP